MGRIGSVISPSSCRSFLILFLFVASGFFSSIAHGAQVVATWSPNPEPDVVGYKVYYGEGSRNYTYAIDCGMTTSCTIPGLKEGKTYYFSATAYNASGIESDFSPEQACQIPALCSFSVSANSITVPATGGPASISVATGADCFWTVTANASWIVITSNRSNTGNGAVAFLVSENTGASPRTATLTVADKTVTVNQSASPPAVYRLMVSYSGTGTGTVTSYPSGSSFNDGTVVTLTANPASSSAFGGWSGACTGTAANCSLTMDSDKSVSAMFNIKTYKIQAAAESNGTISPSGTIVINHGGERTFSIVPDPGFEISDVKVNGVSKGAIPSYTFTNVTSDQSIIASFRPIPPAEKYTLTVNKQGTGAGSVVVSVDGVVVTKRAFKPGTVVTLKAKPGDSSVFDGWTGSCSGDEKTCIIVVDSDVTVNATFTRAFKISATCGDYGSISPSGTVKARIGSDQSFDFIPLPGYKVKKVVVDGVPVGNPPGFTFSDVRSDHSIYVAFEPIKYSLNINKTGTGNGSVVTTVSGTVTTASTFKVGKVVTLVAKPDENSIFSGWTGACSGTSSKCTVEIKSDITVTARFDKKTFSITATSGIGGTISPAGIVTVAFGSSQSFSIVPETGYSIADVSVDGKSIGARETYTFSNVNANHTIQAVFQQIARPEYQLTVEKTGTGTGTVQIDPFGTSFAPGTVVTLTAIPDGQAVFDGWSGACSGTGTTCTVKMDGSKTVTAKFTKAYIVTASDGAYGTMYPTGSIKVKEGGSITFTINPFSGYKVAYVIVDGRSVGAVTSYTFTNVTANHSIYASFTPAE